MLCNEIAFDFKNAEIVVILLQLLQLFGGSTIENIYKNIIQLPYYQLIVVYVLTNYAVSKLDS